MEIWLSRVDPRSHRLRVSRHPHPPVDEVVQTRSLLLHDLAHYAVESELGTSDGFYGLLAAGTPVRVLREHRLPPDMWERLLAVEFQVVQLQTAFKRGDVLVGHGGWRRLRSLWGAWSKTGQGEALALTWPAGQPRVVPARLEATAGAPPDGSRHAAHPQSRTGG